MVSHLYHVYGIEHSTLYGLLRTPQAPRPVRTSPRFPPVALDRRLSRTPRHAAEPKRPSASGLSLFA